MAAILPRPQCVIGNLWITIHSTRLQPLEMKYKTPETKRTIFGTFVLILISAHFYVSRCSDTMPEIVPRRIPDSKIHGANMGPIWCRQDPGGPHVGSMSFAIWEGLGTFFINRTSIYKQLFKFSGRCLMYFMWLKKLDTFVHKSISVIRQPSVNQWRAGRHQNATYVVIWGGFCLSTKDSIHQISFAKHQIWFESLWNNHPVEFNNIFIKLHHLPIQLDDPTCTCDCCSCPFYI